MIKLLCPVRKCANELAFTENGLCCSAGHHFDQAREGYWNLTQPQDKKSQNPGDHRDAVMARHRWLQRGHASGLIESLKQWIPTDFNNQAIVDLGCGDGHFGPALFANHATRYCGIDLSKPAMKLASRSWPHATWVLANADRGIPIADATVKCAISLFGRRPAKEIKRILSPDGICIVAVPGEYDLIELREQVQKEGKRRSRIEAIINEMETDDLHCIDQKLWQTQIDVNSNEIADALAMTYRAVRKSQQRLVSEISVSKVTLAADLLLFQSKKSN